MAALSLTATYIAMVLGIGVLLIAVYYVWDYVFRLMLEFFKIHDLFRQFIFDNLRKKNRKVFKPTIKEDE